MEIIQMLLMFIGIGTVCWLGYIYVFMKFINRKR